MKNNHHAFTLFEFSTNNVKVQLVLPETWQAESLFNQVQKNPEHFSKWLTWVKSMDSVEKEEKAITIFQQKMIDKNAFNLTILVNGQAAGMLDLHNLNNESGEVGYWLSEDYQHLGIMTKSVKLLIQYAFQELGLDYLLLRARPHNFASQNVAERTGFSYLKDEDGCKVYILREK